MNNLAPSHLTPATLDPEKVKLIKNTIAKDATDDELDLFLYHVKKTGLDPMARQIYFQKRFNKAKNKSDMTIITGIDGYRLIADRTGDYAGNDDPVFDDEQKPSKATVTVYKMVKGVRCAFTASARWEQYYPGDAMGFMWRKMPHLMLGKCAEALALRKAFPAELSGLYVKEEMDQAGPGDVEAQVDALSTKIVDVKAKPKVATIYDGSKSQQSIVEGILKAKSVPELYWEEVHHSLLGKPSSDIVEIIKQVMSR